MTTLESRAVQEIKHQSPGLPRPVPGLEVVHRDREQGEEQGHVCHLNRNERLEPLPRWFLDALAEGLHSELFTCYPETDKVYRQLSSALDIPEDHLLLTTGSDAAFKALFLAYVRPKDTVVMLDPSYAMYAVYARMFQAQVRKVSFSKSMAVDVDQLLAQITPGVRLVLIANPNQPTGTVLPEDVLLAVAERATQAGALLVVDEAYYPFSHTTMLPWVKQYPHLLVTRTFSKAAGLAGLRVGYVAGHHEVIGNLFKVRSTYDVNSIASFCVSYVLAHPNVVGDYVAQVEAGGRLLAARAHALGLVPLPSPTNFMPIRVAHRCVPKDLVDKLQSLGFLVKGPFTSPCLEDCIRVTLGPPELMDRFSTALEEAVEALPRPTSASTSNGLAMHEPSWTRHPELVAFYTKHRISPEELYPSEKRFLPWLARQASSVLDIGCAAGGFSNIWRHYNKNLAYTGADVSAPVVEVARQMHPDLKFIHGNCIDGLPLTDRTAAVVSALGVLTWIPEYRPAIRELWRLTDRYLFIDQRLVSRPEEASVGSQQLALTTGQPWDGKTVTPYVCVDWPHFAAFMLQLRPRTILGFGYWGKPAKTAMDVPERMCMATFVLDKGPAAEDHRGPTQICLDLPFGWPTELSKDVAVLPAGQLDELVPPDGRSR